MSRPHETSGDKNRNAIQRGKHTAKSDDFNVKLLRANAKTIAFFNFYLMKTGNEQPIYKTGTKMRTDLYLPNKPWFRHV